MAVSILRIEDKASKGSPAACVGCPPSEKTALRDALAYCSFLADDQDTFLLPSQMARLLVRFYGAAEADGKADDVIDITEERKLYHLRGRPLTRKAVLMADERMTRPGLLEAVARLAIVNDQE